MKGKKYKVTAITHKADNQPVEWIYYSESALTKTECEIRFTNLKKQVALLVRKYAWEILSVHS